MAGGCDCWLLSMRLLWLVIEVSLLVVLDMVDGGCGG